MAKNAKRWAMLRVLGLLLGVAAGAQAQGSNQNFSGTWRREDGFSLRLSQVGAELYGQQIAGGPGWSHVLRGVVNGNTANTTVVRHDPQGCICTLYIVLTGAGPNSFRQRTTGTDGGCGLGLNFQENFVFQRVGN